MAKKETKVAATGAESVVAKTSGGKKKKNFRSTKGEGHGFGISRMDAVVEKYGGYITRASEDEAFSTEVLLPQ